MNSSDLGVLGSLGKALGLFRADGSPNQGWFANPEASLKTMLGNQAQREALIAFVDEAMGGADRETEAGVTWLPIVDIEDPPIAVAVTFDDAPSDGLHIGLGLRFTTTDPGSQTSLSIPLFRAQKDGGPAVSDVLLLGSPGGRVAISTRITLDAAAAIPGQPRLGGIGLEVDLPTSAADPAPAVFGLSLTGLQLPGAQSPRDMRIVADGVDQLDDALLDFILSLIKAQADAPTAGTALAALAGLLGLRSGDAVADFPIATLPTRGVQAIADWVRGVLTDSAGRNDWLGHLATLLAGTRAGDTVRFGLGGSANLTLGLGVEAGPSGNPRLTPRLAVELGDGGARVEATADLFQIDLVTGAALALPSFGVWAAAGHEDGLILDVSGPPVARAQTLRVGFRLDQARRLEFVLAADQVTLGEHEYATLDLTSPDAMMDAAANTVGDVANQLLAGLGDALGVVRKLIGLDPPAGITAVTLPALMADPAGAVRGYWTQLADAPAAMAQVLELARLALADASEVVGGVLGTGSAQDPWQVPLIGPLRLEVFAADAILNVGLALATSVDTLGQRCTVVQTRFAAQLVRLDLGGGGVTLMSGVEATLTARERGANPRRARLVLGPGVELIASHVGLRLAWSAEGGLTAAVSAPEMTLHTLGTSVPIVLPELGSDGTVVMPPQAWAGVETLTGHLGGLAGGVLGSVVEVLGWTRGPGEPGDAGASHPRLSIAALITSPGVALREWLGQLALSELAPRTLALLADLFAGTPDVRGVLEGRGRLDDPFRFTLADSLPRLAVWFPPHGLADGLAGGASALRAWRPGQPGLSAVALAAGLLAEADEARDVEELVAGRDLVAGLTALAARWTGGDGRIAPPVTPPAGVEVRRLGGAASQLFDELDFEDLIGRTPTTTVFVALGAAAWLDAPAGRRVDLSAPGLTPAMFAPPAPAIGDWFVALGTRADCRDGASSDDGAGTSQQAERLALLLQELAEVSDDIAVVALGGAGHAARLAAAGTPHVTDLVTLGTPLTASSLTALGTQPTADALRLLDRLLPAASGSESEDLALGRALVGAMTELARLPDPGADLRTSATPPPAPRADLNVVAVFGEVSAGQVQQAITAIVAAGLQQRRRQRAPRAAEPVQQLCAGLWWQDSDDATGTLAVTAQVTLGLFDYQRGGGATQRPVLHARLRIRDRVGWLASSPALELRALSLDLSLPLDGSAPGESRLVLQDARVFGQSWEALTLGNGQGAAPALPEARVLLASAVQRLTADVAGTASVAAAQLLQALGLIAGNGGVVGDAVDQLIHDPGGLVRGRVAAGGAQLQAAIAVLLGASGAAVDLSALTVRVRGGAADRGRFGWDVDVSASPGGLAGQVRVGPSAALPTVGGLQLQLGLDPLQVSLHWHQSGGRTEVVPLWPVPDGQQLAATLARAVPSLGGQIALELMRRADDDARPLIDAVLGALGLLGGAPGNSDRPLRPLAGLLADPAGWLRSVGALAGSAGEIQGLFDALRPLMDLPGNPGDPLVVADGVALTVAAAASGARIGVQVQPGVWIAPGGVTERLTAGLGASLVVGPSGPPTTALELHLGLPGAALGRQAVHVRLEEGGFQLFLRPTQGPDIGLIPFSGLGALSSIATAALPYLLDRLAEIAGTAGTLVQTVGDALALRAGTPRAFSGEALQRWAADPTAALAAAVPSIVATGISTLAPLLHDFLPNGVSASVLGNQLSVSVSGVTLAWGPEDGRVSLLAPALAVPGIETLGLRLTISGAGLDELSVAVGPARIDAGGVVLRPFVKVSAGQTPAGGRCVLVGLSADDSTHFGARWTLDNGAFALVASDGALAAAIDTSDPQQVALRAVEVAADLVAAVAMAQEPVQRLLATPVGSKDVRFVLKGVVLDEVDPANGLIANLFDPDAWLQRLRQLFVNLANLDLMISLGDFQIAFTTVDSIIGLQFGIDGRFALLDGDDVSLWLEDDVTWINPRTSDDGGLFLGFLSADATTFIPSLVVNGLGLRVGKSSGPLLDAGLTLESVGLHVYAEITGQGARSGGVQLELAGLALSAAGAQGENGIASGLMRDSGPTPPKPAFSPALAIQKHGDQPVAVSLRAGTGDGPWWIGIRKGFGPLYLEQIGFGTKMTAGQLERISLLMDGSVSMFGLTCAVDDLQITHHLDNGNFFSPASWSVDLAGLAVSANMAGVTLAGGLLKQGSGDSVEYLGMLLGRFAVYGLTVYGGYGQGKQGDDKFTAFFAIGAVNGPLGGPPAFFLTGIGGGFGINRKLIVPTDLSNFGDYPLIQALDLAASPSDPMAQLRALGQHFPMQKGTFWFAAGLSFNSFALVDGIAVLGVQIGDGLDINLLGLARMALPRPQAALVSIELALLVHFSSSEGVLWVQGQLTDNSWLLYPDVKITGGFAYVIWFKGEKAGEFVLTLGGYHPSFHRDGYPVVPRLGLRWSIGDNIVIKAGSYFALTSEALMAGGDFEVSASFGPAWAEVKFGANGIVYFDPFSYDIEVYARIAAGVTIDLWIFGEVTIAISLGARIHVLGPDFRGTATFEVGPIQLSVQFGGADQALKEPLGAAEFIAKYLEATESGKARAHAVMTNAGALPAKGEKSTPDGSSSRPFVVVPEFSLTFTSTVPARYVRRVTAATTDHPPSVALGVAPRNVASVDPRLSVTWLRGGATLPYPFADRARPFGHFPVGIWGQPQDSDNRKVPKAEMIEALSELDLTCGATPSPGGPEVPYYQVEIGRRRPLPFTRRDAEVTKLRQDAQAVTALVVQPSGVTAAFAAARTFLAKTASPTALAALRGERQAPPRLGTLTEGLESPATTMVPEVAERPAGKVFDHFIDPPVVVGLLSDVAVDAQVAPGARTTVAGAQRAWRTSPPTLAAVEAKRSRSIAAKLAIAPQAAMVDRASATMLAASAVPPTASAQGVTAVVAHRGAGLAAPLAGFAAALAPGGSRRAAQPGAQLAAGQSVVLRLPNARADVAAQGTRPRLEIKGAPARVVLLAHGGRCLADGLASAGPEGLEIPRGTERIVAIGQGSSPAADGQRPGAVDGNGMQGWHAGRQLVYAGWSTAVGPGCVVHAVGQGIARHPQRVDAGWVSGAELARGKSTVTTAFASAPRTIVIVVDDPSVVGDAAGMRRLLMGLEGAARARTAGGVEVPPVLLTMDNRSVLAYDIVPEGEARVSVTVASGEGWSLVAVMATASVDATGAVALISARGLDAALDPLAGQRGSAQPSQLRWVGATRSLDERQRARAGARGPAAVAALARKPQPAQGGPRPRTGGR